MNKIEDSAQDEIENSRAHNTKFYLYVIDNNETGGIGTYILAPTPAELLACLREFIHNWVGVAGNTEVLA